MDITNLLCILQRFAKKWNINSHICNINYHKSFKFVNEDIETIKIKVLFKNFLLKNLFVLSEFYNYMDKFLDILICNEQ